MREKVKQFFISLMSQDMGKQARQVEFLTVVVFILLLVLVGFLWQYKIEITTFENGQRVVIGKMNIFELLLSKK